MNNTKDEIIVGLDFGTTKICAIVGKVTENSIDIIGIGSHPSHGIRKGVVINIESTVEAIKNAIEEAELMSDYEIDTVYAGIAGGHIQGFNSDGMTKVKGGSICRADVIRVIDAAKAVSIPADREVIHIIPREFIIDRQDGIKDPVGMAGTRLDAKVHIVTGAVTSAQNIVKCANLCGLNVADIVLEPLASSEAVLLEDEKELGTALLDIGGGTSDLAVFYGGNIVHSSVLTLGGNHITNDIKVGIRTPIQEAENLKKKHGCALVDLVPKDEMIEIKNVDNKNPTLIPRRTLAEIIEPRMEEILGLVQRELDRCEYNNIIGSLVITGGASLLEGTVELAEMIFDRPVKRGFPKGFGGLKDVVTNPIYSTGVGLVIYGSKAFCSGNKFKIREKDIFCKVKNRMKQWYEELF
jgi:cell division protein FtsA